MVKSRVYRVFSCKVVITPVIVSYRIKFAQLDDNPRRHLAG